MYPILDSSFVKFLTVNYPATIDTANNLIISEAAKVSGTFNCVNYSIRKIDGLQYFTNLKKIIIHKTSISYLPSLDHINGLTSIDVSQNKLMYLPDLSKLRSLKEIFANDNTIKFVPDLTLNDSLVALSMHHNFIDTLIGLENLKRLNYLQISYNNLRYLPGLDSMSSLSFLLIWKNNIKALPNLSPLQKLSYIDAAYNEMTTVPVLGNKPNLTTAYFNDNNISVINDDFSQCPILGKVRLYNNPITFFELIKVTAKQGYDTIFKMNPHKVTKVAYKISVRENTKITLSTNIDRGVSSVFYDWYKNGFYFKTVFADSLVLPKTMGVNTDSYFCLVRSSKFTDFVVNTDTFNISTYSCIDTSKITINTFDIDCENGGQIQLVDKNLDASAFKYSITSNSGKYIDAQNWSFTGLNELKYNLTIKATDGCSRTLLKPIYLKQKTCEEFLLCPNAESNNSYEFVDTGLVKIYDKQGNVVHQMPIPNLWNGQGLKSHKVPTGFYVADINNGQKTIGITVVY